MLVALNSFVHFKTPRALQLSLFNYLVAWMENIALYESARTGNFSVEAT
jgi:hypothetical protein